LGDLVIVGGLSDCFIGWLISIDHSNHPITQCRNPSTITKSPNHPITRSLSLEYNRAMTASLQGKRVAILVEDGFEDRELTGPLEALREAGATVTLVGPTAGAEFKGKRGLATVKADVAAGAARMKDFDALVIPGGHAPDKMRMRHAMVDLARDAMEANKPVAAICHGPQLLISAIALRGRTLTCWPSIAIDVMNAGGLYVDKPVVEDGNLITSRKPDDVPVFSEAIIKKLEG